MRLVFYKRVNRKYLYCDNCGKQGVKYDVVRVVENGLAYVADYNIDHSYYCSMECLKEAERGDKNIRVKENSIKEINSMGYPA
jgi:hypothetical protein